jgi:hypothetical protein
VKKTVLLSILVVAVQLAVGVIAEAQQAAKVSRIGFLNAGSTSDSATGIEAFHLGLREPGYVEGKNIVVQWRSAI